MNDRYYMLLHEEELLQKDREDVIAIMSEFAFPSIITSHRLKEYGKVIMDSSAVSKVMAVFHG